MNIYKNMESGTFNRIQREVDDFLTKSIHITSHYEFNQKQVIEDVIRLYNSKFEKGEYDRQGFKKYFFNIVRNPCYVSSKAIQFETKDILVLPAGGQNPMYSWIMDKDLKQWMKENNFGKTLNDIFYNLPIYGTVVLKKANNNLHLVDLRNLIVEQTADSLISAAYVIEQHRYTPYELRKQNWDKDKIEKVIKAWRETKNPYIRIVERYGELTEEEMEGGGDPNKHKYTRTIAFIPEGRDITTQQLDKWNIPSGGIVIDQDEVTPDEFPYREFHWEKIPGRWLGIGRVELLSDPQMRTNEIVNLRVKSSYFAAMNLFQSRDDNVKKNLLKSFMSGDVITALDRIERVPTEDRALGSMDLEERKWSGIRDELTLTYDVVRGERMPAGTPLGSAQMAAQMVTSYFEGIQKRVGLMLKEVLYNDVIPMFKKQKEHYVRLVGEDLDKWHNLKIAEKTNKELLKFVFEKNRVPTKTQFEVMKSVISDKEKSDKKEILIPKDFYKDIKYRVDIVITGEARNVQVEMANNAMILQMIQQDPEVLKDPAKRKVFSKVLESMGKTIEDIDGGEQEGIQQTVAQNVRAKKGGGISAPPTMGQGQQGQQVPTNVTI